MKIKKLLIANRGEIALRILRTARDMKYSIVAIFSDQDKDAAHVTMADEKVHLPGNDLSETYLNIAAIIKAAKDSGVDAIHPGYGFLSENPLFAKACEKEGIIFIGPSSEAINAMGNKIAARKIAIEHGIPVTPGLTGTPEELLKGHTKIGFPILVKAAAGGGGKGMRIVRNEAELELAIYSTSSEARNYFGDGTVYIERFFENPRHIEVQILGDHQGNIIHLYERECSMQRRHQKIIEEAPSITLNPDIRERLCSAAIQMARSINYFSAGTIEFLVDKELNFYFLEMNTRIQVEHPVTEMITGVDIVKEQFHIAEGNNLSIRQEDIGINGHAVEVRIYAENPSKNFMPSPGRIIYYSFPEDDSIRMEEPRFKDNSVVFSNFDPMISKVIAWGKTREVALEKLEEFLPQYAILGIDTNITFILTLLKNTDYLENQIHTRYIDDYLDEINGQTLKRKESLNKEIPLIGAMILSLNSYSFKIDSHTRNIWEQIGYWRLNQQLEATLDEEKYTVILNGKNNTSIDYSLNNSSGTAYLQADNLKSYNLNLNGVLHNLYLAGNSNTVEILYAGFPFTFNRIDIAANDSISFTAVQSYKTGVGDIIAPMPGKVLLINVKEGDKVVKGAVLMVIEAMKMENNILAPYDGVIDRILVKQGESVDPNTHLVHLNKEI